MNLPLAGCRVLYTRAERYWQKARAALQALGATALHLPLLDTRSLPFTQTGTPDCSVFTSANAVHHFFARQGVAGNTIAIGEHTAQALANYGHSPLITAPPPYDSEALLAVWQPQGQHIAIIAAPHGRKHLAAHLSASNRVEIIHAYERFCPSTHLAFAPGHLPHAILIASSQTLAFLQKIAEPNTLKLLQCESCVVAFSPRIADFATHLGFHRVTHANAAAETAQFQALCAWWARQQGVMTL